MEYVIVPPSTDKEIWKMVEERDYAIDELREDLGVAQAEIARLNSELARKQPIIASQLTKIEQLENTIQNKLVDISALEDTMSDQTSVRRSVKFNAMHLLQSAIAVLNGL